MGCQSVFLLVSVVFTLSLTPSNQVSSSIVVEETYNRCLDGNLHKVKPGKEDDLHNQCTPWANRSCCTPQTSFDLHYKNMYNFDWDHCQPLSPECKRHFVQDLCFYECSPNIAPWLVKVQQTIRNEKFMDVPLCASDCDDWFEACKDDLTCTNNWGRNFDWVKIKSKTVNKCPKGAQCHTFKQVFGTSKEFCEQVWDFSWKYTENDQPCMRMWFDGTNGNPNDNVLLWKITQINGGSILAAHYWIFSAAIAQLLVNFWQ